MTDLDAEFTSVMARIGCRPDPDDHSRGSLLVTEQIASHGVVMPSALMLLADMVVGMRLEADLDDWTFTTDYSFRLASTAARPGSTVVGVGRPLRHGKRLLIEEVDYVDGGTEEPVGYAQVTFMRTPLRPGDTKPDIGAIRELMGAVTAPPLDQPLPSVIGVEELGEPGRLQLHPRTDILRPGGMVQGAMMTLMGELAARSLAESHHATSQIVTDLDVRYLVGGRTGPLVTQAWWIGDPGGPIRVELRDLGRGGVITTTFLARTRSI